MKQVADAVVLSQSATARLVTRLENRVLLARAICARQTTGAVGPLVRVMKSPNVPA